MPSVLGGRTEIDRDKSHIFLLKYVTVNTLVGNVAGNRIARSCTEYEINFLSA